MTNPVVAWAYDSYSEIKELHNALELLALEMGQASDVVGQTRSTGLPSENAELIAIIHAVRAADDRLAAAVRAARRLPPPPHAASAARLNSVLDHLEEFVDSDLGEGIALTAWRAAMTELTEFADAIAAAVDVA